MCVCARVVPSRVLRVRARERATRAAKQIARARGLLRESRMEAPVLLPELWAEIRHLWALLALRDQWVTLVARMRLDLGLCICSPGTHEYAMVQRCVASGGLSFLSHGVLPRSATWATKITALHWWRNTIAMVVFDDTLRQLGDGRAFLERLCVFVANASASPGYDGLVNKLLRQCGGTITSISLLK